jgi:arginyl-tRNA synthetase
MPDPKRLLLDRLQPAFDALEPGADPVLRASDRADFQANGALALAKRLDRKPRDVADEVVAHAQLTDVCQSVEVSGPGFINLTLSESAIADLVDHMAGDDRLGVPLAEVPHHVLVDYSSPNVAKEMHVGHLRSTCIGDAICRMLMFAGHQVTRENHLGDWGTPFGMLIEHLIDTGEDSAAEGLSVGDLDAFYAEARRSFDADETFRERSRRRVVLLQSADADTLRLWRLLVEESERHFNAVYATLGVLLTDDDVAGESRYDPMLADVVRDLDAAGLLVENDGAQCVFPEGFENREGQPLPLIVQKSDGGYGYAATDLACIRDRIDRVGARTILYVVGAEQAQHLQMCFAVGRMAGWLPDDADAVHVSFGLVLGPDRKRLRSRSGGTVKLMELLEEAVERASAVVAEREELNDDERASVAHTLGIGAVKYADLSTERARDYVFDWDRMLASEGNTGPYLQYAHARIRSIFRRVEGGEDAAAGAPVALDEPAERALGLALLGFADALDGAVEGYAPSKLCAYLFDLATTFTTFYEACPVLKAPTQEVRASRLQLCHLTARVLEQGLDLLGIDAPERM